MAVKSFSWWAVLANFIWPQLAPQTSVIPLAATEFILLDMPAGEMPVPLNRPVGARRPLLSWRENQRRACLYYQVPTQRFPGKVFFQYLPLESDGVCRWRSGEREYVMLEGLTSLRAHFVPSRNRVHLFFLQKGQKNQKEQHRAWPLLNGVAPQRQKWKRYDSGSLTRAITGVYFVGRGERQGLSLWGKKGDRYKNGDVVACQRFGPNCREMIPFQCERCRYGQFEVLTRNCLGQTQKFCGRNRCGEVGGPACLRGFRHTNLKISADTLCREDNPYAFCQQGLKMVCNALGDLVCR